MKRNFILLTLLCGFLQVHYTLAQTTLENCTPIFTTSTDASGEVEVCIDTYEGSPFVSFRCGSQWASIGFYAGVDVVDCITLGCCDSGSWRASWRDGRTYCQAYVAMPCDPVPECLDGTDSDGDGICDPDDCSPNDAAHSTGPGDYCDDGNPLTYNDQYNENCECIGEPTDCGDVWPDDGCPLTEDSVLPDCTIVNIPPNPDDGCTLTLDYFDAENCVIVNEAPDVDDGCDGTEDYFDPINCLVINKPLSCDDGDPFTVWDMYDENCKCKGVPYVTNGCETSSGGTIITNIVYRERYEEHIEVSENIDLSNLTLQDKFLLQNIKYTKDYHYYLDESDNMVKDSRYLDTENMFPQWYQIPIYNRSSSEGMFSYYDFSNKYLTGGWPGAISDSTINGAYKMSGVDKYLEIPHSEMSREAYDIMNDLAANNGIIANFEFRIPDQSAINEYRNMGFEINGSNAGLIIRRPDIRIEWDPLSKTQTVLHYENNELIKERKYKFEYNSGLAKNLLSKSIEITYSSFSNGDCYNKIGVTEFTDYVDLCPVGANIVDSDLSLRSSEVGKLTIRPNPVHDRLYVELPPYDGFSIITIFDNQGREIHVRKLLGTEFDFSTINCPPGVYWVKVEQGIHSFNSKFIKQ